MYNGLLVGLVIVLHEMAKSLLSVYSHLSNSRGGWNKRRGVAKVAKSINVEVGTNVDGGWDFLEKTST